MSTVERVREIAEPLLSMRSLAVYDIEHHGGLLRVLVQREDEDAVGLDELAELTRDLSAALDEHDPVPGRYTLEVSSPGLERPLRTPAHFDGAVGTEVQVKTTPDFEGPRRIRGRLVEAGTDGVVIHAEAPDAGEHRVAYAEIERARTVFPWGSGEGSGQQKRTKTRDRGKKATR